mmetsp:Transcript_9304/g.13205  ORF Transcript_9304/g.13205 Transcript_9304/m.13205 type:complete len:164 (-) Transcript_9304:250-741(-)
MAVMKIILQLSVALSFAFAVNAFSSLHLQTFKKPLFSESALGMVIGPKQVLALEKSKNPQKFEATISGLMRNNNLTREQAEKRYGDFLIDPDGFALRAAAEERKAKGYKNWVEQAVAKSNDPEATRERIDNFTARNRLKGIAIMCVFSAAVLAYSASNPYVPK